MKKNELNVTQMNLTNIILRKKKPHTKETLCMSQFKVQTQARLNLPRNKLKYGDPGEGMTEKGPQQRLLEATKIL